MIQVPLTSVVLPEWGWHYPNLEGDTKLLTSLRTYGQLNPLVVREVNGHYEVVDGRKRLQCLQELGATDVWVLNRGPIPLEEAIRLSMTLELGSVIDYPKLALAVKRLNDDGTLANTTPYTAERLAYFVRLCHFDWDQYSASVQDGFFEDDEHEVMKVLAPPPEERVAPVIPSVPTKVSQGSAFASQARRTAVLDFAPPVPEPNRLIPAAPQLPAISSPLVDPWSEMPVPAMPVAPVGGIQFFGVDRKTPDYTPQEPPCLDGIDEIVINFETTGLRWWEGDRPVGITIGTLDGQLKRFLPFGYTGGNLDEATVLRWAQTELKHKHITNAHVGFEIHMARAWGVDLEAQGCQFSDIQHYAALIDEYRRQFALDVLVKDYLKEEGPPRIDESQMATYHAGDVAVRAEYQVEAVARLRDELWPLLDKEDLQRVRQLEDDVIPVVCEMEKNAAYVNRPLLREMIQQSGDLLNEYLWGIAKDLGFSFNPDKNEDWQKLFAHYQIPVTQFTDKGTPSFTDDLLGAIDHEQVQKGRRAGKIASLRSKFLLAYDEVIRDDAKLRFALHQLRGDDYGTIRGRFSMSGGSKGQPRFGANLQQVFRVNSQRKAFGYAHNDASHDAEIFLVRSLFIPEPYVREDGSDAEYLSCDAQSIEYRLAAHFARSKQLIEAYQADVHQLSEGRLTDKWVDFHGVVGDIIRPYKDLDRNIVKNANFCLVYGGGKDTAARTIGLPREKSDPIVDVWHRMFPEFRGLKDEAESLALDRGYVKTLLGRRARFNTEEQRQWAHAAINYVIQGSAADILKTKAVELHRERKWTEFLMRQTVHDEFDGCARSTETAKRVREILNRQSFPQVRVPIVWEVSTGRNWAEAH